MKISVLGLGYIGLPTSIILAKNGHSVSGYDVNKKVIETLNKGKIHIVENNLDKIYEEIFRSGKFRAYDQLQIADVYIIAVPTPLKELEDRKIADLSYVKAATKEIATVLKRGDLVILESTVPPKTTKMVTDILEKESGIKREDFYTAHCPERVLPGRILYELENNDRIIGAERKESALKAKELYDTFVKGGTNYITDDITAEMAKIVENSYRDVNIAFANELSILCDDLEINVFELIELANKHPRVNILSPGVGVGGHCISVDPWFIIEHFPDKAKLIYETRKINDFKPVYIADKIEQTLNFEKNKVIGILGLAYKPNIDDLRESPSIKLAHILIERGYNIIGCEPNITESDIQGINVKTLDEILEEAEVLVLTLTHKEFLDDAYRSKIIQKCIFDCVGLGDIKRSK